ncbi:MAG: SdpI family protein [Bacilli bacterium]
MKSKKIFNLSLVMLGLAFLIVIISLVFMPDTVPIHYDLKGNIDNYGSKFLFLIMPTSALFIWFIFHLIAKFAFKDNEANQKQIYLASACTTFVFIVLEIIFSALAFVNSDKKPIDNLIYPILNVALGISFIIIGNFLPKLTKNKLIGLRTPWSLYNDNTWNISQRYGGYILVGIGFILIIATIFVSGIYNFIVLLSCLFLMTVLALLFSYLVYKKEKAKETE